MCMPLRSTAGISLVSCDIDMRTGGTYRLEFAAGGSETMAFHGRYLEVVPNERIVWTNDDAAGPLAGTHRGVEAVLTMLGNGFEVFEGTITQEIHTTLADDNHVVEIMTERATVKGH